MSFGGQPRVPRIPTPPQGETVAAFGTYMEAQQAVDHLAEQQFPVQLVTIVGTDLRMVERVTGRMSYPRAAASGFIGGAWFGLFVGLLLSLFSTAGEAPLIPAILFGGAFGLLFSVLAYSFTRRRRDFTSTSQIVASSYTLLCLPEQAHKARALLQGRGAVAGGWPPAPTTSVTPPAQTLPTQGWPSQGSPGSAPPGPPAPPAQAPPSPRPPADPSDPGWPPSQP
ncbi:general stress protein [Cellulomonas alba]|uniref:General stress protein 17M-like domain-containing protein n=1 Tax=Cellulomonas alba TaxID=3053467 RepID=A0ABT7SDD9_9CELL|nr:general stress protein [Cellulomonas alba]MDM7854200.1 hypothetical protein [Cellulomonas alba]